MKIAIIGHSPLALEAVLRFHLHEAAITWYVDQEDFTLFESPHFEAKDFTSATGLRVLNEMGVQYNPQKFTWNDWQSMYETPLMNYLGIHHEVKTDEVVSVAKRFLAPGESILGRSRFLDLFRVIYRVNPKDFIDDQKELNPETYQRLTEEFVSSLGSTIEMYQDYDLVLDLRSDLAQASASVSGRALGEKRTSDKLSFGLNALRVARLMKPAPNLREICLIGSDSLAAEILLALEDWLYDPHSRIFIVSTEEEPFGSFLVRAETHTADKLSKIFSHIEDEFKQEIEQFSTELRKWQALDDFVQVKFPKPTEPIPRLNYFSGHNVSAIDELIDKRRMFVTLERPEFRTGKKHPENNHLDLKTIGVDHVLVGHAKKDSSLIEVDHGEIGFLSMTPTRPNIKDAWKEDLIKLEGIEDEVFKLFSPATAH